MEKRTLLAVLLSAVVWIGWFLLIKPQPAKIKVPGTEISEVSGTKNPSNLEKDKKSQNQSNQNINPDSVRDKKNTVSISKSNLSNEKETYLDINTNKFKLTFTNKGAALKSVFYKEKQLKLTVPKNPFKSKGFLDFPLHFNEQEFLNGGALDQAIWSYNKENDYVIHFNTELYLNKQPLKIEKKYSFAADKYDFKIDYKIINISQKNITWHDTDLIVSAPDMIGPNLNYDNTYNNLSSVYSSNNDFNQARKGGGFFSKDDNPLATLNGNIDWFGIMSRYFLCLMVPENFAGQKIAYDNRHNHGFRTGIYLPLKDINPQEAITSSFKVYLGLKDKQILTAVDERIKEAADISKWIEPIRWVVMWSLLGLNKLFGNLGWSLVIFSLLTKIIFMPLTLKSTNSMKKMQTLSPKINEIKKKYKDKPNVMQQEIMKMYKENKVNPMGGCFPMLLQMPFFFALYSALISSIDLWHAPFILWIKDLSMPDTIMTLAGFNINILPIVMTGSTLLQQKLTTVDTGQGQQQKIMMMLMPIIFLFIFWNMPSGLVLYWTLQNLFQVAHQVYTNKKTDQKK